MELTNESIREIVEQALREDIGHADITTLAVIPRGSRAEAQIVMKEQGVVAGMPVVAAVFAAVDPGLVVTSKAVDGQTLAPGGVLAQVVGEARSILTGERVALNFLQRLCGIATLTAQYVDVVAGLPARVLDTRKTTPGLRVLEKYAVRVGGGSNHRFGLYDAILLKDNHLALLAAIGVDTAGAVRLARAAVGPMVRVEVEVESVAQAEQAAAAGANMILLDNLSPSQMREAVAVIGGRAEVEASGGISLDTIRAVAESGVGYISVGALTHSARGLDISLDMRPL